MDHGYSRDDWDAVILASALHDIGKFEQRGKHRMKHARFGEEFVLRTMGPSWEKVSYIVGAHHDPEAYTQGAATYEEHITFNGTALDVDIWKGAASDSLAATGDGTRSDGRIGFVNYSNVAQGALKIDYIFTRKYAANPATYAWGSEESEGVSIPVFMHHYNQMWRN